MTAIAVVGVLSAGAVVVAGPAIAERIAHPRDEAAFTSYVDQYLPGWRSSDSPGVPARDRTWVQQHPDAVLAEAEAACAWLASQPDAPDLVPSGSATVWATVRRYQDETGQTTGVDIDERSRGTIVVGAWEHLCHGSREAHTSPESADQD